MLTGSTSDGAQRRRGASGVSDGLGLNVHFIGRDRTYSRPKAFNACESFVVVSRDLRGRKDSIVDGRMAVRNKNNRISERHRAPSGRVYAAFALKAADDEAGDAPGL